MIYLDNAATTKPSPGALAAAERAAVCFFNPSSLHSGGREAEKLVESARLAVAEALGSLPEEVVFTSGGTEGDNLALLSLNPRAVRHVIVSAIEHDAVIEPARRLASLGVKVDYAPAGP
ncbi:MAG: aminotransferase class V-fold PLP-dependent enzyme, partial [Clostridia bacterium]|nr:aminotransferase class V-fold PLP-dependent enzyme [Clostridia bacterium]